MATMTLPTLSEKMKDIDFGMLSTKSATGTISSRPMSNNRNVDYDGESRFFAYGNSRKVADIENDPVVSLTFTAAPSLFGKPGIFLSVEGSARLIRNKETFEKHWDESLDRWFPEGVDTPDLVMIEVQAAIIKYWDGDEDGQVTL